VPSELRLLTWADVDFVGHRLRVSSPKTEHHEGGGSRAVPLFGELLPYLQDAASLANPGIETPLSAPVVSGLDEGTNLRTTFQKIIGRAKLKPWPKLFQNLRASRSTELASRFPAHVAAAWLGHSVKMAARHYLQVTEADFESAARCDFVVVHGGETGCNQPTASPVTPLFTGFQSSPNGGVAKAGLEPATHGL
jgi:integrase